MPVVQLIGYDLRGPSSIYEDDSARTEPEATSPETDTPARLFAEICYLLYQGPVPRHTSIYRFSTSSSGLVPVTYGGPNVGMLCINQDQDEM
jgi:hypothetical protein